MIIYTLKSILPNAKADDFYNFMINAPQDVYANWLPDEHYEYHVVKRSSQSPVGDLFYFDQNIGKKYRMKFNAVIINAKNPNNIVFQMRKCGIKIPGYLELNFSENNEGLQLTEILRIGFNGIGLIFDPFIKLIYGKRFYNVFKEHHKREWQECSKLMFLQKSFKRFSDIQM
jgi:hypothetical protein